MSSSNDNDSFLDSLLTGLSQSNTVRQDDIIRLSTCFYPDSGDSGRAKAFVVLSAVCNHFRRLNATNEEEAGTHNVVHALSLVIDEKISDSKEKPLTEIIAFVAALFAVDRNVGSMFFIRDGFQDSMMDALDLFPSSSALQLYGADMLAAACGYKSCRASLSPRCIGWLGANSKSSDSKIKSLASLALLKILQGAESENSNTGLGDEAATEWRKKEKELFLVFRDTLISSESQIHELTEVIEGMAYLSTLPAFRSHIANDDDLLRKITSFAKSLHKKHIREADLGTAPFGLAVLVANLCAYRPKLSEDQEQIAKLSKMARSKTSATEGVDQDFDDENHIRARAKRLTELGAAELLVSISRASESQATLAIVGKAFMGLVEDKGNRGRVLQAGGAKSLMATIRVSQQKVDTSSKNPLSQADMEFSNLEAIQALSKLSITASPIQVFGPDENVSIDAIKPFACLLLHANSTLLQRFEALMALTNLSSTGPNLADRIARTPGIINKLEFLLLDDNKMVRRASAELVCNLVSGSEFAFTRCSGDISSEGAPDSTTSTLGQAKSRLHVLIALADVEDEATRLAASGALAVLTGSPNACKLVTLLEVEHHRTFSILKGLIDPDSTLGNNPAGGGVQTSNTMGIMHRGVVCIRNILVNLGDESLKEKIASEAVRQGVIEVLAKVIKLSEQTTVPDYVLQPTAEALKWLIDIGVNVFH
jgi:hypothetical protein